MALTVDNSSIHKVYYMTHPSSCHNCFEKCPRPTENVGVLALFLFATRQHVAASARRGVTTTAAAAAAAPMPPSSMPRLAKP